jgi:predicted nucleotidyltransferase component of viral defense system
MTKKPANIPASVRQRLLDLARRQREDFQLVLVRYALERLLYRLGCSKHADRFVLKGALLFSTWVDAPHRPTRDLDLLGYGDPSLDALAAAFRDICSETVEDDGLRFDPDSVSAEEIREDQEYGGVRVHVAAGLAKARINIQVDIGFGDAITPDVRHIEFPALLDFPTARVRAYPPETVVAEKLQAMMKLGIANSRMKDFYDLWALSQTMSFRMPVLAGAIGATFQRRGTDLPVELPMPLTAAFAADQTKLTQWRAYTRKTALDPAPPELSDLIDRIAAFAGPALLAVREGGVPDSTWPPGGPWSR